MRTWRWDELNMRQVAGPFSKYMTPQETALLVALVRSAQPRVMIEFGCNEGMTARRILDNVHSLERYIGIDAHPGYVPALECQRSEVPQYAGRFAADDDRFSVLISPLRLSADELEECDAVFIDGDHSYDAVIHESRLARELARAGGIVVWHDYSNPAVEVTRAVDQLSQEGWPIDRVENSWLAFMRT